MYFSGFRDDSVELLVLLSLMLGPTQGTFDRLSQQET